MRIAQLSNVSYFLDLRDVKIVEVKAVHDYVQLVFANAAIVSIYNCFTILPESALIHDFSGKTLSDAVASTDFLTLTFCGGLEISVDLRDQGYRGPEALQINSPGMPTVVWN